MPASENLAMIAAVARALGPLKDEVVFVGGTTVDLYISDPAAPATRGTDDVDCVVEVSRRGGFYAGRRLRGDGTHPVTPPLLDFHRPPC